MNEKPYNPLDSLFERDPLTDIEMSDLLESIESEVKVIALEIGNLSSTINAIGAGVALFAIVVLYKLFS